MKKAIGMFVALFLALGMSGLAYAHWSEVLWIEGTVTTGELCLEWSVEYFDVWPGNTKNVGTEDEFDVADVGYDLIDDDGDGYYEGLEVWCYNAYPSLWIEMCIDIHNCGSIPAGFYDIVYLDYYMDPEDWLCGIDYEYEFVGDCEQIDPCESVYLYLDIHFPESTPESAYAEFYVELEFWNWNELI